MNSRPDALDYPGMVDKQGLVRMSFDADRVKAVQQRWSPVVELMLGPATELMLESSVGAGMSVLDVAQAQATKRFVLQLESDRMEGCSRPISRAQLCNLQLRGQRD